MKKVLVENIYNNRSPHNRKARFTEEERVIQMPDIMAAKAWCEALKATPRSKIRPLADTNYRALWELAEGIRLHMSVVFKKVIRLSKKGKKKKHENK